MSHPSGWVALLVPPPLDAGATIGEAPTQGLPVRCRLYCTVTSAYMPWTWCGAPPVTWPGPVELLALSGEPGGEAIRPTAVLALACVGRDDEARSAIAAWGCARPFDWSWDFNTALWSEISVLTGLPDAGPLYDELLPRADDLVVAGTGVTSWGSTRTILGLLARRLGHLDVAHDHLTAAVAHNRRVGARPFEARARYHLARLLVEEPGVAGSQDLDHLLDPAAKIAAGVGMDALLADIAALQEREAPGR